MDNYIYITSFPNKIFGHPRNPKQSLNRVKNLNGESFVEILNMANRTNFCDRKFRFPSMGHRWSIDDKSMGSSLEKPHRCPSMDH